MQLDNDDKKLFMELLKILNRIADILESDKKNNETVIKQNDTILTEYKNFVNNTALANTLNGDR